MDRVVPSLTSRDALVPKSSEVSRVLGPRAVQLRGAEGKPGGAAVFGMPIAVPASADVDAKWELVDLDWQTGGSRLAVKRPAVPVSLPAVGSGQVRVGDLAARLAPAGAVGSTASVESESVVYPNVAADTDLVVRSLSVGVQVGWVLRSPEADEAIRVPLELPAGLSVRLDGQGGVRIVDSAGRPAGSWSASTAVDAGGFPVPLETSLDGTTVVIRVSHRAEETQYPVVVDPYFQAGGSASTSDFNAWEFSKTRSDLSFRTNDPGVPGGRTSLFLGSGNVGGWASTDIATLGRPAPGDQTVGTPGPGGRNVSPEHAYWSFGSVRAIKTRNRQQSGMASDRPAVAIGFSPQLSQPTADTTMSFGPNDVYLHFGPWYLDYATLQEVSADILAYSAPGAANSGAWAVVSMLSGGSNVPDPMEPIYPPADPNDLSTLSVTSYSLNAADDVAPTLDVSSPAGWLGEGDVVRATGTDRGLGISSITASIASSGVPPLPPAADSSPPSCPATGDAFCTFVANADFSSHDLQEGIHEYTFGTTDGGGRTTTKSQTLNVDRSAPIVTLGDALYSQRAIEINPALSPRKLDVTATDGNPLGPQSAQRSGVQRIEVYVDDELVHEVEQTVAGDSKGLSTTWTPVAGTFTSGEYTVDVVVTDRVGHETRNSFVVKAPCCGAPLTDDSFDVGGRLYAFGDVDLDGRTDAVLVNTATGAISVRAGNGDGTFASEQAWGTFGTAVDRIAVGDVDADERADVVARTSTGALALRIAGGAAFSTPDASTLSGLQTTWPVERSLGLADVDGDGTVDVWGVDGDDGELWVGYSRSVAFDTVTKWSTVSTTRKVQLSDLDGDGLADLVNYEPSNGKVLYHQSSGADFAGTDSWGTGPTDADVTSGDVNGDGRRDMVFRTDGGDVLTYVSEASGGFSGGPRSLGSLAASYELTAYDLTGDGRADVVGTRLDGTNLLLRSAASSVPDPDAPDVAPVDPDPPTGGSASALSTLPTSSTKPTLMMQDDSALLFGQRLSARTPDDVLSQMRYLGASAIRVFVWWGQVDRLHPDDEAGLVQVRDANEQPVPGVFDLARDVGTSTDLTGTTADTVPQEIAGQPRKIRNRYHWGNLDQLVQRAASKKMSVYLTITGGTPSFTECQSGRDSRQGALRVRGCVNGGTPDRYAPTGLNPDPVAFGHFVTETVKHFRSLPGNAGTAVAGIGVWNEPNLPAKGGKPSTFLTVTDNASTTQTDTIRIAGDRSEFTGNQKERDTARRYGELYAQSWMQLDAAGLVPAVKVAFGEMTSGAEISPGESSNSLRTRWPAQWLTAAATRAREYGTWPNNRVRADALAIHPYGHGMMPWKRYPKYPWSTMGLRATTPKFGTNGRAQDSVKKRLTDLYDDGLLRTPANSAARIWATEFGYFNTKEGDILKGSLAMTQSHGEVERNKWMAGSGSSKGALEGIAGANGTKGPAEVLNLYQVVENPPKEGLAWKQPIEDDYGFMGAGLTLPGGYTPAHELRLGGSLKRPYGKVAAKVGSNSLAQPSQRRVACTVRAWSIKWQLSRPSNGSLPKC